MLDQDNLESVYWMDYGWIKVETKRILRIFSGFGKGSLMNQARNIMR